MKRRIIRASKVAITSADETKEQLFKEKLDQIEDDFSFVIAGIEKLARSGGASTDSANSVADKLAQAMQDCIAEMAAQL